MSTNIPRRYSELITCGTIKIAGEIIVKYNIIVNLLERYLKPFVTGIFVIHSFTSGYWTIFFRPLPILLKFYSYPPHKQNISEFKRSVEKSYKKKVNGTGALRHFKSCQLPHAGHPCFTLYTRFIS